LLLQALELDCCRVQFRPETLVFSGESSILRPVSICAGHASFVSDA
jgi:hypothetical protein